MSSRPAQNLTQLIQAAREAAQRDQVFIKDVRGRRIVSIEARWMATLIEESFRTWEFLIFMAKKVIKESCHDGLIIDSSGQQVDLATIPTPGEYTWVLQATPRKGVTFVKGGPWLVVDTCPAVEEEKPYTLREKVDVVHKPEVTWKNTYEWPFPEASDAMRFACDMCLRDGGCVITNDASPALLTFQQIMPEAYAKQLGPLLQEMMEPMHSNFRHVRNALSLRREWAHKFTTFRVALYPFGDHDVIPYAKILILPFYEIEYSPTAREDPDKSYTGTRDRELHGKVLDASVMCPRDPLRVTQMMPPRELLLWHFEQCVIRCLRDGCPETNGLAEAEKVAERKASLRSKVHKGTANR